jgi:hypothetical protein
MVITKARKGLKLTWEEQKNRLKQVFPRLENADLSYNEYQKAEMFRKLEFKLGITTDELVVIMGS